MPGYFPGKSQVTAFLEGTSRFDIKPGDEW
jgi:hypothetical protein